MKKLLAVLLALSVAGSLFAFDLGNGLTMSGALKTGVKIEGSSQEDNPEYDAGKGTAFITPWNNDAGHPFRAETSWKYVNGDSGFAFRFRAQISNGGFFTANANSSGFQWLVPYAYGWMGFGNGLVELSGGLLDYGKWGTVDGFDIDSCIDNDGYLKIEIKPMDGLSFGINTITAWPFEVPATVSYIENDTRIDKDAHQFTDLRAFWATTLGAKYTSDLVTASLEGRINKKDGTKLYAGKDDKYFELLASAKLSLIENLPIFLDFRTRSLTTKATGNDKDVISSDLQFGVKPVITLGALTAGLRIQFKDGDAGMKTIKQDGNGEGVWALEFRPSAVYQLNQTVKFDLELGIGLVDNWYDIGDEKQYDKNDDAWKGGFYLQFVPKVIFDFGNGAKIDARYNVESKTSGYTPSSGTKEPKALVVHKIMCDLIWSF